MGAQRNAAARAAAVPGAGRARQKGGGVPRRAQRGRRFAGAARARRSAGGARALPGLRGAGAFLPAAAGSRASRAGLAACQASQRAAWPGRGRRGAGTWPGGAARAVFGALRGGRGEGAADGGRGAVRPGAAPRCRGAAGGGAGKTAAPSAACVGFQATSAIEAAARAKKPVFAL